MEILIDIITQMTVVEPPNMAALYVVCNDFNEKWDIQNCVRDNQKCGFHIAGRAP
ncbi:MAG: hypothetical protein R2784_12505 [Saprospiraceae bacterium]